MSLRVLVVTNMWPVEGDPAFGVFVRDQVEACRAAGATIEVMFVNGRRRTMAYAAAVGATRARLASGDHDLVHAHHALAGAVAWLAGASRPDPPLLLTHHGIEVFEGWQAPLARGMTRLADRTLVVSQAMAEHLRLPASAVLPMGYDPRLFRPGDKKTARLEIGAADDEPLVVWIGADRPEKRLALARAAVERLRARRADARLLVVSGQPREDVARALQAADAYLLTSTREGAPVAVKEALACGVPVVSTDVGDVADLVRGLEGCAVVGGSPDDLAAALERAVSVGRVDASAIVGPYSVPVLADRLLTIYEEVAADRTARARRT
jgi:glycosyltransferase involved in cell wall biosynthesis